MYLPALVGIVMSIGVVAALGRGVGFDRDRAFYPTVLIVVASYYVLFAAMSGVVSSVVMESMVMAVFVAAAVIGFRSSLWITAAAIGGHGVFDLFHGELIVNSGVPPWWPAFCGAFDLGAGACLAWIARVSAPAGGRPAELSH
jgi:hypothetical protein